MKNISTFAACALCAVPALVQPAMAEEKEPSPELNRFLELLEEGMMISNTYVETLKSVEDKKMTGVAAAELINKLCDRLSVLGTELEEALGKMTQEEQEQILKEMTEGEFVENMQTLEKALTEMQERLATHQFFGTPELQAACERFMEEYF